MPTSQPRSKSVPESRGGPQGLGFLPCSRAEEGSEQSRNHRGDDEGTTEERTLLSAAGWGMATVPDRPWGAGIGLWKPSGRDLAAWSLDNPALIHIGLEREQVCRVKKPGAGFV